MYSDGQDKKRKNRDCDKKKGIKIVTSAYISFM